MYKFIIYSFLILSSLSSHNSFAEAQMNVREFRMLMTQMNREHRYREIKELTTTMINADPNSLEAYEYRGGARYLTGNKEGCIEDFSKLAKLYKLAGNERIAKYYLLMIHRIKLEEIETIYPEN